MKYCIKCERQVNITHNEVNIGIADIWNDHCEECGSFIDSGFRNVKEPEVGDYGFKANIRKPKSMDA